MSNGRRKKFVSKWQKVNPIELVADRIKPATKQDGWYMELMLKQSSAINDLMHGCANRDQITDLIQMHNITVALQKFKTGDEYRNITDESREAIVAITARFGSVGRYVATGPEMNAIRNMLELHTAQLDVCTVGQVHEAYEYAVRVRRSNGATRLKSFMEEAA